MKPNNRANPAIEMPDFAKRRQQAQLAIMDMLSRERLARVRVSGAVHAAAQFGESGPALEAQGIGDGQSLLHAFAVIVAALQGDREFRVPFGHRSTVL